MIIFIQNLIICKCGFRTIKKAFAFIIKIYSINTFVDPEDPSHEDNDKTVDVTEVIKIIRESKTRPSMLFLLVNNNIIL